MFSSLTLAVSTGTILSHTVKCKIIYTLYRSHSSLETDDHTLKTTILCAATRGKSVWQNSTKHVVGLLRSSA